MQLRKRNRIISLSIIYTICFGSILLAFPKTTGYTDKNNEGIFLWSAKKQSGLPVQVQWWEGTNITSSSDKDSTYNTAISRTKNTNNTTSWSPKKTPIKPSKPKASTKNHTLTCEDVWICDKVRFLDGYTTKQKTDYYTIILTTVDNIQKTLPANYKKLSDTLFSITLSPTLTDRRGRWGSKTIIINTADISSLQEFREILTHELGHIIDLWSIVGTLSTMDTSFTLGWQSTFSSDDPSLQFYRISRENTTTKKADAVYTDFVGWYAMTTPYEDFSESFNMYLRHQDVFRAMANSSENLQKKYNYIKSLLWNNFFQTDRKSVSLVTNNSNWRPWDSTRMSLD